MWEHAPLLSRHSSISVIKFNVQICTRLSHVVNTLYYVKNIPIQWGIFMLLGYIYACVLIIFLFQVFITVFKICKNLHLQLII